MKMSHPSRRSFLSSLAILSAGTAFGSVTNFFQEPEESLRHQWKQFCLLSGAQPYPIFTPKPGQFIQPCKGHFHTTGKSVLFANSKLVAVPTWVSWGNEKSNPDDLIITFVDKGSLQKIGSINRFELTALLTDAALKSDQLTLIRDITRKNIDKEIKPANQVKTHVHKGGVSRIEMNIAGNKTFIKRTIIYNV